VARFADDFVCTGSTKELLEEEIRPLIGQFLQARGLTLSPEKTKITRIEDGFDFLGQNVRKYDGKLLIRPSAGNIKTFLEKVRTVIRTHQHTSAGVLIVLLNPLIRGWANYHRHVVSKRVFSEVDCVIFRELWRWAERRHPQKGRRWMAQKYFLSSTTHRWSFFGQLVGKDGESRTAHLCKASDIPITRHIKIRGEANPYDPAWEIYFEKRLGVKIVNTLPGRRKLVYLWMEQKGRCPVCEQQITTLSGWHQHHLVRRTDGGGDGAANLVLLHPDCHSQVHSQGLKVVKPRSAKGVREA
jgi:RNA-directed DNA polymerase